MSTYMPKVETVERKWYILDAAGKPLGRVAAQAATMLRGKNKPTLRTSLRLRRPRYHHQLRKGSFNRQQASGQVLQMAHRLYRSPQGSTVQQAYG